MGSPVPCIYRVPRAIRKANPRAYTPQIVLIGPLHRSSKLMPVSSKDDDTGETSREIKHLKKKKGKKFKPMEIEKMTYFDAFSKRLKNETIEEMKQTIYVEEERIKESYKEKDTIDSMTSDFFVDLIHQDSIFIMEFIMELHDGRGSSNSPIVNHHIDSSKVIADLMLLENQLPYFILDKLFSPHLTELGINEHETLEGLILELFSLQTKIKKNTEFKHFTDMFRCVYEESLDKTPSLTAVSGPPIAEMQNAGNLSRVGVEFKAYNLSNFSQHQYQQPLDLLSLPISIRKEADNNYSLHVAFKKSCLQN
ncbi:PREDICTED: UPF0481 protein At3g47200-like [Camelina sativa]|uniref:UPF0481 protein At3g47200-like n=1 Tax=Camelina sativa TaxID=90675 RepID=A0ABM0Y2D0_CAMSA|nr:PREDICTED: UPF0481 protein At3g47200-like [Camelina sativa]XP_010494399.1 PREDICTED: UPF0481 protein At3g47200-like [Camelina sativa]